MTMTAESHAGKAVEHLKKLGLRLPKSMHTSVSLPRDLSELDTKALTNLMTKYSSYLAYVKARLAMAEIWHADYEDRFNKAYAVMFTEMKFNNPDSTVTALREEVKIKLEEAQQKVLVSKAKVTLLAAVHDGADQGYTVLSRELTRRTSSFDRNIDT